MPLYGIAKVHKTSRLITMHESGYTSPEALQRAAVRVRGADDPDHSYLTGEVVDLVPTNGERVSVASAMRCGAMPTTVHDDGAVTAVLITDFSAARPLLAQEMPWVDVRRRSNVASRFGPRR